MTDSCFLGLEFRGFGMFSKLVRWVSLSELTLSCRKGTLGHSLVVWLWGWGAETWLPRPSSLTHKPGSKRFCLGPELVPALGVNWLNFP